MTFELGYVKLTNRLNKSSTNDYVNIDFDPASEAVNKAMSDWLRRTYHGSNQFKEGVEESTIRVDDLQIFLKSKKLSLESGSIFSDSTTLPSDYRYHNSFSFLDTSNSCGSPLLIPSNLREESNANFLLNTDGTRPSLQFEQCFHTLINNRLRLYHNGEFSATEGTLVYYRNPKIYDLSTDGSFELKDDVMELIIDEAAKIISGDTGNMSGFQRNSQSVESNN